MGSDLAEYDAGWNAAVAVLAAMYDRLRTGRGQRIDVSIQESELTLNRTRLSRFNNDGVALRREGSRYGFMGMMRCRDGWVQLVGVTPAQWDALAASPDAGGLADPEIATATARAENMGRAAAARHDLVRTARQGRRRSDPGAARVPGGRVRDPGRPPWLGATRAPGLLPRSERRPRRAAARSWSSVPLLRDTRGDPIGAGTRR